MAEVTSCCVNSKRVQLLDFVIILSTVVIGILYSEYSNLSGSLQSHADSLNVTKFLNQSGLFFNRNPKAGSETIWGLIDRLAIVNNFNGYSDSPEVKAIRGGENTYMNKDEEKAYIDIVYNHENLTTPYSYVKHINFINFEDHDLPNPIYINFVRHPIERLISWYYYIRQGWYQIIEDKDGPGPDSRRLKEKLPPGYLKMAYEDCVELGMPECQYNPGNSIHYGGKGGAHFSQISFFCGMDKSCDVFEGKEALERAKSNVEKYYAVVGVLERMQESLEVLENFVPAYFKDARKVYKEMMNEKIVNQNAFKPKVPRWVKDKVAQNFTTEIEFYDFCKQRLYKQYLSIK